jgi:hypothetical protein
VLFVRDYLAARSGCGQRRTGLASTTDQAHPAGVNDDVRAGLVRPVRLDPAGRSGPTRGQARGPRWRRSSHGFYVPSSVDRRDVEQRILEASVVVPPGCAITGWAALRWLGARWFSGVGVSGELEPVTVLVGTHDIRPQPGIAICAEGTGPDNIVRVDGVSVTLPAWSTAFLMRRLGNRREGVVAMDMAAYADLASLTEVGLVLAGQSGWTGAPQGRWALGHATENAWSPREVWMRLVWSLDGGFACPRPNVPIFDRAGRHLGTPDLIDPAAGVIGEYQGVVHLHGPQRVEDINRGERFREHGLEIVERMAGDRRDDFLARLAGAYRRAARHTGPRTWTTRPPAWWTPTLTVAQRRALSDDQRARYLRYRAG